MADYNFTGAGRAGVVMKLAIYSKFFQLILRLF